MNIDTQLHAGQTKSNKTNQSYPSFKGLRQVLDINTIEAFAKKVQILGDTVIYRRSNDSKQRLVPTVVTVAKTTLGDKKDSKTYFSLFEKGVDTIVTEIRDILKQLGQKAINDMESTEKAKLLEQIDQKELGIIEVQLKDLAHTHVYQGGGIETKSVNAIKKAYDKAVKVLYLVSYEGDKYKGIGSKLLDCAVDFGASRELGVGGKIYLQAKNLIPKEFRKNSPYCRKRALDVPVEFYLKYGLRADNATNKMAIISSGPTGLFLNRSACRELDGVFLHLQRAERQAILARLKDEPLIKK